MLALTGFAHAQGGDAAKLFDQGKTLFDARRYAEACELLAQSNKASRAVGTLGLLAACHEKVGRRAAAYREYLEAADLARQLSDPRESFAREQATALGKVVGFATLRPADPTPGLALALDAEPVAPDQPVAVDPGRHEVVARAPGRREAKVSFEIAATQRSTIPLPPLAVAAVGDVVSPPPMPDGTSSPTPPPPVDSREPSSSSPLLPIGIAALAAGVVGLGVGVGMGIAAIGKKNDLGCDANNVCKQTPAGLSDYATLRTGSTIGFWAGGIVAAAGVVLIVVAPSSKPARAGFVAPYVSPLGAGVRGAF